MSLINIVRDSFQRSLIHTRYETALVALELILLPDDIVVRDMRASLLSSLQSMLYRYHCETGATL